MLTSTAWLDATTRPEDLEAIWAAKDRAADAAELHQRLTAVYVKALWAALAGGGA